MSRNASIIVLILENWNAFIICVILNFFYVLLEMRLRLFDLHTM